MKSTTAPELKNFNYLTHGIAIGLGFTGLIAALGNLANAETSAAERTPAIAMYSAANIKFPIEKAKNSACTSDAWLCNCMGETHIPIP